jgi:hypothetical protein
MLEEYARPTQPILAIADRHETGGILVVGEPGHRAGNCMSRGALLSFRSLFFSRDDRRDTSVFAAAEETFEALGAGAQPANGPRTAADATRLVAFSEEFLHFARSTDGIETGPARPAVGDVRERPLTEREEFTVGQRSAPLDPGTLRTRDIGGQTVSYHRTDFEFPQGTLAPNDKILLTGGDAIATRGRFNGGLGLSGCTACGICGACAACTLCAEINFAVAAEYLVAVDFSIHLL